METTSWEGWCLRWAKWPARQPAGVSTGRWFDTTTLQSDGAAGEGWPQVSVCCQSSSDVTGRSQSNDAAELSCNFAFTLGSWSANQQKLCCGLLCQSSVVLGRTPCSYAVFQKQQKAKRCGCERTAASLKLSATETAKTAASLPQWWDVFVYGTTKCSEGSHAAAQAA